ncbi:MAG: peptidoglycan-associated lipoprotein Pal [Desulfobacterales bacterium]
MQRKLWICLALILLVPGLLLTVSCAKKTAADTDTATKMEEPKPDTAAADQQRALEEERLAAEMREKEAAMNQFMREHVYFAFDSAALSPMAQDTLRQKAAYLKENPGVSVTIEGHCDERGTNEYNLALGERRAESARSFLVDLGISASRMTTISYGEERPADPGHNEEAWSKNRRAQFVIN